MNKQLELLLQSASSFISCVVEEGGAGKSREGEWAQSRWGLFLLPSPLYMNFICTPTHRQSQIRGEWGRQMHTAPTMRTGTKCHRETVTTRGAPSDPVVTELRFLSTLG